ncbi:MAG: hypothetical protein ABIH26_09500 [Candidatus Eisenbacteria bacterium]
MGSERIVETDGGPRPGRRPDGQPRARTLGTYTNCLETKEWTRLEPGISEHKYYAPGVGLVLEEAVQGGSGRVELIETTGAK